MSSQRAQKALCYLRRSCRPYSRPAVRRISTIRPQRQQTSPISATPSTTAARKPIPPRASTASTPEPAPTSTSKFTPSATPPPPTARNDAAAPAVSAAKIKKGNPVSPTQIHILSEGFSDPLPPAPEGESVTVDWARSFHGLSDAAFSKEARETLLQPLSADDIEIKPDGIMYLPEIKYRRILNKAFGPGGWGLAPRSETIVSGRLVTREYGLVAGGRLVSVARGEQQYFDPEGIPTAAEGCKSNALMRCCKDLGIASELWDPRFIRKFMATHSKEVWVEHVVNKKKRKIYIRKDDRVMYPYRETS